MSKTYVYDLTCLISQQVYGTPSGTVRVDLRYAHFFHTYKKDSTLFVKQQGDRLLIIDHDEAGALIHHLLALWELGKTVDSEAKSESNLEFRMRYHGMWDPDLDTFFSMPFLDRFNFLMKQELTEIFGVEFDWVKRLPQVLKFGYAVFGALSRYPAVFLLRTGQFVGVFLHSKNMKDAVRFVSTRRDKQEFLLERITSGSISHCHYVYTAYNRGFPFQALDQIKQRVTVEYSIFIHDLIIIYYPEYFLPVNHKEQVSWMKHLLTLKPHLIANSETTTNYIRRFAEEYHRDIPAITTAFIGVEPCFLNRTRPESEKEPGNYFVVISTIEPRKNHLLLLNIWRELAQLGIDVPELFLVGKRGWENENIIDMVERCEPLQGLVHEFSNLNDSELMDLVEGARALLYPSFSEGWGMPIAESLALGTPVICSDIPELRESGQNIPEYIHPIDGKRWMEVILDYSSPESGLRMAQLERIKQYNPPTWEQHFNQIAEKLFPQS